MESLLGLVWLGEPWLGVLSELLLLLEGGLKMKADVRLLRRGAEFLGVPSASPVSLLLFPPIPIKDPKLRRLTVFRVLGVPGEAGIPIKDPKLRRRTVFEFGVPGEPTISFSADRACC